MSSDWIFLSYELSPELSAYGGAKSLEKSIDKQMSCGDTCNASSLHVSAHSGTHIDYPFHFSDKGKTGSHYQAAHWIFSKVQFLTLAQVPEFDKIFTLHEIKQHDLNPDTEIILFNTGFHKIRGNEAYWSRNPGFHGDVAAYLKKRCPSLRAIGMDSISMNPWMNKDIGREAHKSFLVDSDLLIVEDMNFSHVPAGAVFETLVIAPLRIEHADGAPCTALGKLRHD